METRGRRRIELIDSLIFDTFLDDFQRIIESKGYRRLAHKAQVISSPVNPHIRTRLSHTSEVIGASIVIASQLDLNVYLCMAAAAGHDIGHTPFGHLGERIFSEYSGKKFKHAYNSVLLAQHIERNGSGLNLTIETLEAILNHSRDITGTLTVDKDGTREYSVVMFADKIAYTLADLNDAIRYGSVNPNDLPRCALELGMTQRERSTNLLNALVRESREKGYVIFSEGPEFDNYMQLRDYLASNFYKTKDEGMHREILKRICDYFEHEPAAECVDPVICASLLTDNEAVGFGELNIHMLKPTYSRLSDWGVWEIIPSIAGKRLDYTVADLDWGKKAA